jgi:hypothetical protein
MRQFPVPTQSSLLDFLFAREEVQGCGDNVGVLSKLFRDVALADDYAPGWVPLYFATVRGNLISECSKFLFPVPLLTLDSGLIGFQTLSGRKCNSDSTSDHCAGPPVQGDPRKTACDGIDHLE